MDPGSADGWATSCRTMSSNFLSDIISMPSLKTQINRNAIIIHGAHIVGGVTMHYLDIDPQFEISGSRIAGDIILDSAHFKRGLSIVSSQVLGAITGELMSIDEDCNLGEHLTVTGGIYIPSSRIGGSLRINSSNIGMVSRDGINMFRTKVSGSVNINGTNINGPGIFDNSNVGSDFTAEFSQFSSRVAFTGAAIGLALSLDGAQFAHGIEGSFLDVHGLFSARSGAVIHGEVNLTGLKVGTYLMMDGGKPYEATTIAQAPDSPTSPKQYTRIDGTTVLVGAQIGIGINVENVTFVGDFLCENITVKGEFDARNTVFKGDVVLENAKIEGSLSASGARFEHVLEGDLAEFQAIFLDRAIFLGPVSLIGARGAGNFQINKAHFAGDLVADRFSIHGSIFAHEALFIRRVILTAAVIDGNLELPRATLGSHLLLTNAKVGRLDLGSAVASVVDLTGASIGDLVLRDPSWTCLFFEPFKSSYIRVLQMGTVPSSQWQLGKSDWKSFHCGTSGGEIPVLVLRNTHVEVLQDTAMSWPPDLDLEGFRYDRLGTGRGEQGDIRERLVSDWQDWIERDRIFSPQPYFQLAAVLSGSGRRSYADDVLFAGRMRDWSEVWERRHKDLALWLRRDLLNMIWLSCFGLFVAFGIGLSMLKFALAWVILFSSIGAILIISSSQYIKNKHISVGWCYLASLHYLLPVVSLHPSYQEFFDHALRSDSSSKLRDFFVWYFHFHRLVGWVLGIFVLASLGGLVAK